MANIKIIKKQDGYAYECNVLDDKNIRHYVSKSGFKTPEKAREEARKVCDKYIKQKEENPIKVEKTKHIKLKNIKPIQIKNLDITDAGYKILIATMSGAVILTAVAGGLKVVKEIKDKFPPKPPRRITDVIPLTLQEINVSDCDFSNVHFIIRTANDNTTGVGAATVDMLTRLGVSNEIISSDSDLVTRVRAAINENPNSKIVLINLESGLENSDSSRTIIMGDSSNTRQYSSDVLASCINTSFKEYDLNPVIRSGEATGSGWRMRSYIEDELNNAILINSISQLTIDLPPQITEDTIIRNDAAAGVVEGIMRWTCLDVTERYNNIYYTAEYGDTVESVGGKFGISGLTIEENSDINIYRNITVGDTLTIGAIPRTAESNITVNNPYTTSNSSEISPITNTYVVQSGDTLTRIANMYGVQVDDIITTSGNPNNITVGETLFITTYNLYETHERINLLEEEINHQL